MIEFIIPYLTFGFCTCLPGGGDRSVVKREHTGGFSVFLKAIFKLDKERWRPFGFCLVIYIFNGFNDRGVLC